MNKLVNKFLYALFLISYISINFGMEGPGKNNYKIVIPVAPNNPQNKREEPHRHDLTRHHPLRSPEVYRDSNFFTQPQPLNKQNNEQNEVIEETIVNVSHISDENAKGENKNELENLPKPSFPFNTPPVQQTPSAHFPLQEHGNKDKNEDAPSVQQVSSVHRPLQDNNNPPQRSNNVKFKKEFVETESFSGLDNLPWRDYEEEKRIAEEKEEQRKTHTYDNINTFLNNDSIPAHFRERLHDVVNDNVQEKVDFDQTQERFNIIQKEYKQTVLDQLRTQDALSSELLGLRRKLELEFITAEDRSLLSKEYGNIKKRKKAEIYGKITVFDLFTNRLQELKDKYKDKQKAYVNKSLDSISGQHKKAYEEEKEKKLKSERKQLKKARNAETERKREDEERLRRARYEFVTDPSVHNDFPFSDVKFVMVNEDDLTINLTEPSLNSLDLIKTNRTNNFLDNYDDPFTRKEGDDFSGKNWSKSKNSPKTLSSATKDFEKSAVDFLTTGRHESKHIDPKIVNEIINDPATPKNIVKLLERTNNLQNSTDNKELRDLSITTTELVVYAETLSRKIAEDAYKASQEEARLNNAIKDKIINIATNIGEYLDIAAEELEKTQQQGGPYVLQHPVEGIKLSVEAAGNAALECCKLAALFTALETTERIPVLKDLYPEIHANLEKKSLEKLNNIIDTVGQNFYELKNLPPQEHFRTAVNVGINAVALVLVAKSCSQIWESLRTNSLIVNDLKAFANTAEEMASLESSAQLIAQEQKLVHAVEQIVENNLTQASEHIPGAPKFNQKIDALAKEFAESETGKKIGARLEKSASEKARSSGLAGNTSHSVEVEIPEAVKNFNPANQNAIKKIEDELIRGYEGHIFSKNHKRDGILKLGKNESEIIKKITDIILETDQVGLIKVADENIILTVIQGKDVIIKATLNETGKIISMNGYLNTSSTIPSKGNVVRYISEKYK